jgi:hypothetical protein
MVQSSQLYCFCSFDELGALLGIDPLKVRYFAEICICSIINVAVNLVFVLFCYLLYNRNVEGMPMWKA